MSEKRLPGAPRPDNGYRGGKPRCRSLSYLVDTQTDAGRKSPQPVSLCLHYGVYWISQTRTWQMTNKSSPSSLSKIVNLCVVCYRQKPLRQNLPRATKPGLLKLPSFYCEFRDRSAVHGVYYVHYAIQYKRHDVYTTI